MRHLQKIFLQGLFALLPLALTAFILISLVQTADNIFGPSVRDLLPFYIPGVGVLLLLIVIFLVGLLLNSFITKNILENIQKKLNRVPFIKAIYSPLSDLMNLFAQRGSNSALQSVVFIRLGAEGPRVMGLVTRDTFEESADLAAKAMGCVSVYVPMSYGLGGFTFLVPKNQIEPVDLPIEKAMSLAITGWVKADARVSDQASDQGR